MVEPPAENPSGAPSPLAIRLLGEFGLDGIDLDRLRSRQARTVLKRLALAEGDVVSGDALIDAVWAEAPPADPARDLYVLLSRARTVVGADRLVRRDRGYALRADWWDRAEMVSLTREAARRRDANDLAGARAAAEAALTLARGPLLADEPDADWLTTARSAADSVVGEARQIAAATALATGRIGDAANHARAALRHDPYDEAALRTLMQANVAAGQPASALTEFAQFRQRLVTDLGVDPAAETRALHTEILQGTMPEPVVPVTVSTTVVGREAELRLLDEALARSRTGAQILLVVGEPGIGKTALLEQWAASARARGAVVLAGRAEEHTLALQPVLDALAAHRALGAEPAIGLDPDSALLPLPGASPEALNARVFDELTGALRDLAGSVGLALVIDDADDADPVTWSWLGHLGRRAPEHHVLVVVARRGRTPAAPAGAQTIHLAPLTPLDVERLVGPERAAELCERTGGNPLLLTELVRSPASGELPDTLREAVARRVQRTGEAARTLQTAAVLSPVIDLDLLAGVLSAPPLRVLDHIDVGLQESFLVERQGSIEFRHDLVRAAIAAEAGAIRRAWIHRQAVRVLRTRGDVNPMELAGHARDGGDPATAAEGLAEASDLARARLDLDGAQRLLDEAVALADTATIRIRRSRIRMARADIDGADVDAEAAMAEDRTGEALELRAWAARNRHDLGAAIRLGNAAAEVATDPLIRSSALIAAAFGHRGNGDLRAAEALLAQAASAGSEPVVASGVGPAAGPAPALGLPAWVGVLRVHQGRPLEALSRLEPMLGAAADRGLQGYWTEHTLQMTAHAYGLLGRPMDALRVLDRLAGEIERRGTGVRFAGLTNTYRSWVLRNLGVPGAEDLARAGVELAGGQEIRAQCDLDVADCLLRQGHLDQAVTHLEVARRATGNRWFHNRWRFDSRLGMVEGRLRLAADDPDGALELAVPVAQAAGDRGDRRYAVLARLLAVAAMARLGQSYDAERLAADLRTLPAVAALEAWWLAADVADASGSALARATADQAASRLAVEAGDHADIFRRAVAARLG